MRRFGSYALLRTVGVFCAVGIITTGATFASLQSQQAALVNNVIESATADLRIGTSSSSFSNSRTGFTFKDLIPGGSAMPAEGNSFYLKNYGTAKLALKIAVSSMPGNVSGVDLSKVFIEITRVDTETSQKLSLASLIDAYQSGGVDFSDALNAGVTAQYKVKTSMASDAFNGSGASIDDIDLVFSGSAIIE